MKSWNDQLPTTGAANSWNGQSNTSREARGRGNQGPTPRGAKSWNSQPPTPGGARGRHNQGPTLGGAHSWNTQLPTPGGDHSGAVSKLEHLHPGSVAVSWSL